MFAVPCYLCSWFLKNSLPSENVGTASIVGQPDRFNGLIADCYSLKTKKIPAGRLELGDWLGH